MDKPTRFFINTEQLPGEVTGKLVAMGKQLLTRFDLMREAGMVGDVWTQRTNEGIIFKLDKSGDVDNVKIFMPMGLIGKKEEEKYEEKIIESLVVGVEYTDGLIWQGTYWDNAYYPNFETLSYQDNYRGFGVVIGQIKNDEFSPSEYIKWEGADATPVELKYPWVEYWWPHFAYKCQGETDKTYYSGNENRKIELVPLKEVNYDATCEFDNLSNQNPGPPGYTFICTCGEDHAIPQNANGINWARNNHCTSFTGYIPSGLALGGNRYSVDGKVIVEAKQGCVLTYTTDWHFDGDYASHYQGEHMTYELFEYSFDEQLSPITGEERVAGIAIDENTYFSMYSKCTGAKVENLVYDDDYYGYFNHTEYSGSIRYDCYLNISGVEYKYAVHEDSFSFSTATGSSALPYPNLPYPTWPLCARIFSEGNEDNTADLIYAFSFYDGSNFAERQVDSYGNPIQVIQYGYVIVKSGTITEVKITTKGYPVIGYAYDSGYGDVGIDYEDPACALPGVPTTNESGAPATFYGSSLIRLFKEKVTEKIKKY